jgi:heme exporter protein A
VSDGYAVLEADSLAKKFGALTALRSVSITVHRGESLVVFGRNGAGKTTLLRIIATLTRTYQGTVRLFGEDLRQSGDAARNRIGFVSHESMLYADLSVRANLMFFAKLHAIEDPHNTVETMIDSMDLRLKATASVRTLSRGLKQRVALARAFLHKPEFLLLDEPFTGLDERAAGALDTFIDTVRADGRTILMTTHDAARGWRQADRAVVLDRGAVVHDIATSDGSYDEFHVKYREILAG